MKLNRCLMHPCSLSVPYAPWNWTSCFLPVPFSYTHFVASETVCLSCFAKSRTRRWSDSFQNAHTGRTFSKFDVSLRSDVSLAKPPERTNTCKVLCTNSAHLPAAIFAFYTLFGRQEPLCVEILGRDEFKFWAYPPRPIFNAQGKYITIKNRHFRIFSFRIQVYFLSLLTAKITCS